MSAGKKPNKTKVNNLVLNMFTRQEAGIMLFALFLGLLASGVLIYTFLPSARQVQKIPIAERVFDDAGLVKTNAEGLPFVEVDTPVSARLGDVSNMQARLSMAGMSGQSDENMVAEFYLDMDGSKTSPDGNILYPILGAYPAQAKWQFVPFNTGSLSGTIWVHLQIVKSSEETRQYLVMAYPFEVKATALAGIPAGMLRIVCIAVFVLCVVMLLSFTLHAWVLVVKRRKA